MKTRVALLFLMIVGFAAIWNEDGRHQNRIAAVNGGRAQFARKMAGSRSYSYGTVRSSDDRLVDELHAYLAIPVDDEKLAIASDVKPRSARNMPVKVEAHRRGLPPMPVRETLIDDIPNWNSAGRICGTYETIESMLPTQAALDRAGLGQETPVLHDPTPVHAIDSEPMGLALIESINSAMATSTATAFDAQRTIAADSDRSSSLRIDPLPVGANAADEDQMLAEDSLDDEAAESNELSPRFSYPQTVELLEPAPR